MNRRMFLGLASLLGLTAAVPAAASKTGRWDGTKPNASAEPKPVATNDDLFNVVVLKVTQNWHDKSRHHVKAMTRQQIGDLISETAALVRPMMLAHTNRYDWAVYADYGLSDGTAAEAICIDFDMPCEKQRLLYAGPYIFRTRALVSKEH